jgi:hypothetical protein
MRNLRLSMADVGHLAGFAHGGCLLCLLCSMVPWSLGGLSLLYVLDVPGNLLASNMVTNPLHHAFKCMLQQSSRSFPAPIVLQTAVDAIVGQQNPPSPASVHICWCLHCMYAWEQRTVAVKVLPGCM